MKTYLLTAAIFLYAIHGSLAQTNTITPRKIYRTWIETYQGYKKMKEALCKIKDSSIMVSNSLNKEIIIRATLMFHMWLSI